MQSSQIHSCCDQLILQRLLSEQLSGKEESAVLAHIEQCTTCRTLMAQLSGCSEFEQEIEQHLADHGIDDLGLDTVIESNLIEAEIDQIKEMLGPTDDPHMMGRLGAYEVVALIGRGSTGIVFKAFDRGLNRFVAIKMLMPCFSGNAQARERFAREGRSIASVRDQHVVQVFAVSEHKGIPFIVMEYLPAGSLAQRIRNEGPLLTVEVTRIGMQIATALAAAHMQGIVHRDVKPANVLLANGANRALVTDFGLARLLDEASMTHSGAISGTPQYMSPEQAQGANIDHRSDLFSLGSVLYNACTAQSPFRSETVFGVIKKVCDSEPRPIQEVNPAIEGWMCDFVEKLHQKQPEDRFQTAAEVADFLAAELAHAQAPTSVPQPTREWQTHPAESDRKPASKLWPAAVGTVTLGVLCVLVPTILEWPKGNSQDIITTVQVQGFSETRVAPIVPDGSTRLAVTLSRFGDHPEFDQAAKCFNAGEFVEAIKHFKVAAQEPGLEGLALYSIGCSFAYLDQEALAIDALQSAIAAGFANKQHYLLDQDLDRLRETQSFQQLLTLLDDHSEIHILRSDAETLKVCEQYSAAESKYRKILELSPESDDAAMNLGLMLHLQHKLDDALPWHQRTARSECYSHFGYYNIACYHAMKGQTDEAMLYLEKAIDAGYVDIPYLEADKDLDSIRLDTRYCKMIELIKQRTCQQVAECNRPKTDQS